MNAGRWILIVCCLIKSQENDNNFYDHSGLAIVCENLFWRATKWSADVSENETNMLTKKEMTRQRQWL